MTKAEEFKEIAAVARRKSDAQIKYDSLLEDIANAAKVGMVALAQTKYTVEGLKYTRGAFGAAGLDYDKLYAEQDEIYDLLRKDGFTVKMEDPDVPSTLDINLTEEARQKIEITKRCIEKQVFIIWDIDEFNKEER